ncbi:hypothetical protein BME96_12540 [Virgibacillus halodenitrificans]|uniref:Rho termination factor N-terminal domain-containing protein n=1 Tax=Virgibacillus halodenitrificans TaxID=1482 RepID=A0AAC9NLG6_VIRHA|nr:hypothetical protein [Virgibacillus halodenitrificans]APC48968.1 hypothetical protein BME96_12540 [Virgibacillus halodenitrificans]
MKVFIRKTAQGSEYWDNKEKRTLFVPAGKKPGFEVTEDPESMIGNELNLNETLHNEIYLDDMNKEQLLEFAEQNEIDVPGNMSKEDTIRKHIADTLAAAE